MPMHRPNDGQHHHGTGNLDRRTFLQLSGTAAAGLALPVAGCAGSPPEPAAAGLVPPFELEEVAVAELRAGLE
ncbi:MAG: hypothetical protein FIB01_00355, partial [Gemmatimonadetes bacterium]|nr:hypothetical protein [Gemmatimonadota bacterium]